MARWAQRNRRGGGTTPSGEEPPAAPDPPLFDPEFTGDCEEPSTQAFLVPPPDLPAGAASFDVIYDIDIDPPVDAVAFNVPPGVPILMPCASPGSTRFALMRAYNAEHTLYTDSTISSQAV